MKPNKIIQPEQITVKRSQISFADYNPRYIEEDARKMLKRNLKEVGLLGGIVWNKRTGNLVSGHQRVSVMDSVNRYNPETQENDYEFKVEVVDWDLKREKEQNLFMNNKKVQGKFDDDKLRDMIQDIDYQAAGFDDFDLEMLGIGEAGDMNFADFDLPNGEPSQPTQPTEQKNWAKGDVVGENEDLAQHDQNTMQSEENTKIDRRTDFYNDTEANQLARHNEVQKIKDRINSQNDLDKDGGVLSYVVISFKTPSAKWDFMEMFGYDPKAKYINGEEFQHRLEFGDEDYQDDDSEE